jgi:hypothetical protein
MHLLSEVRILFLFGLRDADSGVRSHLTSPCVIVHFSGVRICPVRFVARRGTLRVSSACNGESVPKCLDINEAEDSCLKEMSDGFPNDCSASHQTSDPRL